MAKIVTFINKNYFFIVLGISVLSLVAFFCPFTISKDSFGDTESIYIHYIFKDFTSYHRFAWGSGIKLIGVLIPIAICLVCFFVKKQEIVHASLISSLIFNGALIINNIYMFIPWLSSYYYPHVGYVLFLLTFLVSIFVGLSYMFGEHSNEMPKSPKTRQLKPKKQKPLKPAERIEILELKLQISELEKQIQVMKKDG